MIKCIVLSQSWEFPEDLLLPGNSIRIILRCGLLNFMSSHRGMPNVTAQD